MRNDTGGGERSPRFFAQPDVPANLARYKALFVYEQQQAADGLGEDFDERLCQLAGVDKEKENETDSGACKAPLVCNARLQPLYRAVAILAVVLVIGNGVQYVFDSRKPVAEWDYNPDNYQDSYNNPKEAYETLNDGIEELKDVLSSSADSAKLDSEADVEAAVSEPNNNVRP